jgi:hypothetical protein
MPAYRSLAGALQYLTLIRPNLAYVVQQVCLFMHDPRESHLAFLKCILRYVKGTLSYGLRIGTGPVDSLTTYSDVDWAGCPDSRRSTSSYCVLLGDTLVSWSVGRRSARLQSLVPVQRENIMLLLMLLLSVVGYANFFRNFMFLSPRLRSSFFDNVCAVYMAANLVHHRRTKHIEIDIHFVREKVALGQVRVLHVPSSRQFADIMTKGLPVQLFTDFRSSLGVCQDPPATVGGCQTYSVVYGLVLYYLYSKIRPI